MGILFFYRFHNFGKIFYALRFKASFAQIQQDQVPQLTIVFDHQYPKHPQPPFYSSLLGNLLYYYYYTVPASTRKPK